MGQKNRPRALGSIVATPQSASDEAAAPSRMQTMVAVVRIE
jgi:hypothetical protein